MGEGDLSNRILLRGYLNVNNRTKTGRTGQQSKLKGTSNCRTYRAIFNATFNFGFFPCRDDGCLW